MSGQGDTPYNPPQTIAVEFNWQTQYTPLIVVDQVGNEYICLNRYEAQRIAEMMGKLDAQGKAKYYNSGDWWHDVPTKIIKWFSSGAVGSKNPTHNKLREREL